MVGWCSLKGWLIVSHKHSLHWLYVGDHPNWITALRGLDPSISSPHFAPSTRLSRHEHGEQVIGRRQYAQLHAMSCYVSADMFLAFFWPVCARFSVLALSDSDWRSIQPGHFKKAGRSQQADWALHIVLNADAVLSFDAVCFARIHVGHSFSGQMRLSYSRLEHCLATLGCRILQYG